MRMGGGSRVVSSRNLVSYNMDLMFARKCQESGVVYVVIETLDRGDACQKLGLASACQWTSFNCRNSRPSHSTQPDLTKMNSYNAPAPQEYAGGRMPLPAIRRP
jgi:hypothetical protein